ncbi:uroporphyrinogen decarboxylase family protein [uncultured Anaerococcus sp.]|uniref:uroporphyrinogen decarboxylase family protein n=1 Tax=uncultured Anaerococcus sp. TaxID=293428 RepID=UPI00262A307D|nr:uroporphyrinogen decarboxylase family protein [uncultured Anaerococcus sp.]
MDKEELQKELSAYNPQMTSDQRLRAYFNGERVDHLPYNIMSLDVVYGLNMGYSLKETEDVDNRIKIIKNRTEEYKVYGISEGLNLRAMGYAIGSTGIFPNDDIDHVDHYILSDKLDMDLIELPDPYNNKLLKKKLEDAKKLKENFPDQAISTFVAGPISTAAAIRPISKLLRDLRKNPEGVKELLEFCVNANMKWVEAFKNEFGPVGVMIADPVGCDDILSPKQVDEFSYPYIKDLTTRLYKLNGIKPNLHICGHTDRQWEMISKLDIGSFSLDNCHDLTECKEKIENSLSLMGNVPPVEVMRNGSIDDVIESVKQCIKDGADNKNGYICATGCGTPAGTPKENLDAFVYAVQKYSKNAKIGEVPEAVWQ